MITKDSPHFNTTFRHSEIGRTQNGKSARVMSKGPNAVLADGHVEQRINFADSKLSDDNFNIPVR